MPEILKHGWEVPRITFTPSPEREVIIRDIALRVGEILYIALDAHGGSSFEITDIGTAAFPGDGEFTSSQIESMQRDPALKVKTRGSAEKGEVVPLRKEEITRTDNGEVWWE